MFSYYCCIAGNAVSGKRDQQAIMDSRERDFRKRQEDRSILPRRIGVSIFLGINFVNLNYVYPFVCAYLVYKIYFQKEIYSFEA
jgi:hypothetical protein